jgi:hypothetical protein
MLLLLYVATCVFVGWLASLRGHNLLLYSLLSIVITPLITLLIVLLLVPAKPVVARAVVARTVQVSCPRCSHELKHLRDIEYCSHCGEPL